MKRKTYSVLLAGLLALAGCKSTSMDEDMASSTRSSTVSPSATTGDTSTTVAPVDSAIAANTAGTDTSMGGTGATASTQSAAGVAGAATAGATPNGSVTSIEVVPRQPDTASGSGTTTTGDRLYRVTLRMDDGRTQVVTQEWTPSFSTGDRVRMVSGVIQK